MKKSEIRLLVKNRLVEDKETKSKTISEILFSFVEYISATSVFIYMSNEREVDTQLIIKKSFELGKKVFVPKIIGSTMEAVQINFNSEFTNGQFGIKEPLTISSDGTDNNNIDLAIIPLFSFDNRLNRLGHGKAFYDKWLNGKKIVKIGLSYEEYKTDSIPEERHDVKMDVIITQSGVYREK